MAQIAAQPIVASATPVQVFEDHESTVLAVAVFPDGRRMVTSSGDKTLRLWDLKDGTVLKKMEGHRSDWVRAVAVSKDGRLIASGDFSGELIVWHGDSGEQRVVQPIKAHPHGRIMSLDFSIDGAILASGASDNTTKLWSTETEHLAIATDKDIQIWNSSRRECIANFNTHAATSPARIYSLAWTPDGTRLFSGGSGNDPTIREWDLSTKQQVGDPWDGHTDIYAIAVNPAGTLVVSASDDKHVRLWRLWDRRTIAIFKHFGPVCCVTFSMDGKHILSGSQDKKISKWAVPEDASPDCKACLHL
ncbi:WD40 repeat-like protein [Rhizopogon vinicolor AM-OR11-026]|uniref:WD40 repeat-like protein n=1 Tax=Rhizopogon vinicolor AM-OR11-026 TaxID=1314800 RepID=A0A1B7NCY2_9AGAM|nr:WD40 repeat-like protein [Rhizopogon vinicolor AM-OR11-026]